MIGGCRMTRIAAGIVASAVLLTACVRRTSVQDFGLPHETRPAAVRHSRSAAPDDSFRAVFKQQTQGAFNPLEDDPRAGALERRLTANPADVSARLELAKLYESYRL